MTEPQRRGIPLSRALTYARSMDEVLDITVERAVDAVGAEKALVMLADSEGLLRIRACRGVAEDAASRFCEPLDETLIGRLEGLLGPGARDHFLGVPLVVRGAVIGLLAVARSDAFGDEGEDERVVSGLADQAAIALGSARLEERAEILEQRLTELEADRSSREYALQVVSHDLRSPLNAIGGYAQLLRSGILGEVNERQRETLQRVEKVLEHLEALLEDVLKSTRPGEEKASPASSEVSVPRVVKGALNVVGPAAKDAGIGIEVDVPEELVVWGHPDRLRQVLVHLVDNAVKYSSSGSLVRIEGRRDPSDRGRALISVSDQGPGIPPDRLDDIFQPYERLPSSMQGRSSSGVGLGLAIARKLVMRMGGDLTVRSTPGEGSTFTVALPSADPG